MRRDFGGALVFRPLSEMDARAMVEWRYEGPYAFYDAHPDDLTGLLDPENAYYAVTDSEGELLGFCCFGADARVKGGDYQD
jgi:hypothetical protein